jgi:hypothetical protein
MTKERGLKDGDRHFISIMKKVLLKLIVRL